MSAAQRRRPTTLTLEDITQHGSGNHQWPPCSEDIPVRGTFIDFGSLARFSGTPPDTPLPSTPGSAPARLVSTVQGAFDSWKAVANPSSASTSSASCAVATTPTGSGNSSARCSASSVMLELELEPGAIEVHDAMPVFTPTSSLASLDAGSRQSSPRQTLANGQCQGAPPCQRAAALYLPSARSRQSLEFPKRPIRLADEIAKMDVAGDAESSDDGESSDEDQGRCPVYSANAVLPSVGSAAHSEGKCKRCCFFPKGRCSNGVDCQFCHFAHEKRKAAKTKKKKSRRRNKRPTTMQSITSSSTQSPHAPSVHQILGSALCCVQPLQPKPANSKLIVHDLQFVSSSTVTPTTMPVFPTWH